ncbi:MAG: hypothetical protein KUA43_06400 [Hoeflea sp.]|uniref:hypothetical protein n=1 Tax=Hoeflea sp. TaxID=1940281 RepID=UPI001D7D3481|nr:hypothetical protein [Hoeflea sp.]MBU4530161.1 hypothetical protein [Alphaproteobacteria bacterium]MBU4542554.1 hypothetical protein [Alphaproteobacteria bacterium]MBU4551235.1 hypothetical protein [Alphaproteobacteria bacterium]MBV1723058.1 hypothetical protein [Hoeflea sp.]MBV1760069.1 hypothetical protein [Hoeflea sp.]
MTDIKPWWQSKTLWGALVTIGSAALGLAGLELGDRDREALIELLTSLGAAIGGVIAIFGRITAKSRIG